LTFLFIAEFGLKIIAYGIRKYLGDTMNWIDAAVVVMSIV
jgi:hypothetical protein